MEWDTAHLGEKQAWLEATLRSIQDAVIATDGQGRIRFLNREAARLTGWSESDACGRLHSEVLRIVGAQDEFLINRDGYQIPSSTIPHPSCTTRAAGSASFSHSRRPRPRAPPRSGCD